MARAWENWDKAAGRVQILTKKRRILALLAGVALVGALAQPAGAAWLGREAFYRFIGAGFGHGVGMSQYGAKGMAETGYSGAQILEHYYQGTALAAREMPYLRVHLLDVSYSGMAFHTSGNVVVTNDAGPQSATVAAPDSGPPAVISADGSGLYLTQGPNFHMGPVSGPLVVRFDGSLDPGVGSMIRLTANNLRYEFGRLEVTRQNDSPQIRTVMRDLHMERYLLGLSEMPSSWHAEALKAQAIAGRTYSYEKVHRLGSFRPGCSCSVSSSTGDQVYTGMEKVAGSLGANWRSAVEATSTLISAYQGQAIQAFYSSSSGGFTENVENVFSATLPYLRGVPDPWDANVSPYRGWGRAYRGVDLERWLNRFGDTSIGPLFGIELRAPFGVSGRVLRPSGGLSGGGVRLLGYDATKQVSGERFRQVVNSGLSADGRSDSLLSTLFQQAFEPYSHGFRGGVFVGGGTNLGQDIIAAGAGEGGGPHVVVADKSGSPISSFFAYDLGFTGGVRIAVCDLNNDGRAEIVTAAGPGGGPHVRVFDPSGVHLNSFFAYDPGFTGGVYVACGEVDNVAGQEIVTGAGGGGGPHVRIFTPSGGLLNGFFAYDVGFTGGVRVAVGNFDGSGSSEVATGAGPGGGPHVKTFAGSGAVQSGFFPYGLGFTGGVYVGSVAGAGRSNVVTGAGESGSSHLRVLGMDGSHIWEAFVFGGTSDKGVRVASVRGEVLASAGAGAWPMVRLVP